MLQADYVIDMGPKAGRLGGEVVFAGTPKKCCARIRLQPPHLNGLQEIAVPAERRKGNGSFITIHGATGNNLEKGDCFSLGTFDLCYGVSGSGKSVDKQNAATYT